MSHVLTIEQASYRHAVELSMTMRDADLDEIRAASGRLPFEVLLEGLRVTVEPLVALVDGRVMAMYGVVDNAPILGPSRGVAWMLTSSLVDLHPRLFWRACKEELSRLLEQWDELFNAIDCRHEKALRWAKRLGFKLSPPEVGGVLGLPFSRFTVSKEDLDV